MESKNLAIRFGLGAIKAVGLKMIESVVLDRKENGNFKDIYDFCARIDAKYINKKSIEALAKAGAFDDLLKGQNTLNRRQIFESFDILSRYGQEKKSKDDNYQMNLFAIGLSEEEQKPKLKEIPDWSKEEKLKKEFEAFGFFLGEHPIDDFIDDLKKRGVIFSNKIESEELEDNDLVKIAAVVASSKHRSGSRGRFAYLTMSDPYGIYEITIFDEELINQARDLIADGSMIVAECLIRKDDGGLRILVRNVLDLKEFIQTNKPKDSYFEDIKKQPKKTNQRNFKANSEQQISNENNHQEELAKKIEQLNNKKSYSMVEITIKNREPLFNIKSFLSTRLVDEEIVPKLTKITKITLIVIKDQKIFKIALADSYLLDESDCSKLRLIEHIIDVEAK